VFKHPMDLLIYILSRFFEKDSCSKK